VLRYCNGMQPPTACDNCGEPLSGAYCSACGQRVLHHGLSLGEFLSDAAEVITHADSRFWRTFAPLLIRPGFLTQQYIKGRRASYLPPFRLYLVLSVVFFLVIPLTTTGAGDTTRVHAQVSTPAQVHAALQKELDETTDPEEKAALQSQLQNFDAVRKKLAPVVEGDAAHGCSRLADIASLPAWFRQRLVDACAKTQQDQGRGLGRNLVHNLGRAMFVLLPLLAALMMLLYWRPRRHYVEHLLLLLHNHAFVFIALIVLMIANRFILSNAWAAWFSTILSIYMVVYLYQSMRRVYGQGWARTLLKFSALSLAYLVCAVLMFLLTTIYSAITL
jgi:Protein of unknown function (DUF3667)